MFSDNVVVAFVSSINYRFVNCQCRFKEVDLCAVAQQNFQRFKHCFKSRFMCGPWLINKTVSSKNI